MLNRWFNQIFIPCWTHLFTAYYILVELSTFFTSFNFNQDQIKHFIPGRNKLHKCLKALLTLSNTILFGRWKQFYSTIDLQNIKVTLLWLSFYFISFILIRVHFLFSYNVLCKWSSFSNSKQLMNRIKSFLSTKWCKMEINKRFLINIYFQLG